MKNALSIFALLAATATMPLQAQDMSAYLNPSAMAAQLGLSGPSAAFGPDAIARMDAMTASPGRGFEAARYIPTSPRPVMRPALRAGLGAIAAPAVVAQMPGILSAHGDTLVVSGANRAVISGAETAIVRSNGVAAAMVAEVEAPRRTLWQRIFGL